MAAARRQAGRVWPQESPARQALTSGSIPASVAAEQAAFQTHQSFRHSRLASIP